MTRAPMSWSIIPALLTLLAAVAPARAAAVAQLARTPVTGVFNGDRVDLAWSYAGGTPDSLVIDFHDGTTASLPGDALSHRHVYATAGRFDLDMTAWTAGVPETSHEDNFVVVAQRPIPGTNVMFVHHSTGRYMLRDAGVRGLLASHAERGGTAIRLWDHDYHSGNSFTGIILPDSTVYPDWSYGVEANNIRPDGYRTIYSGSAFRDSLFARHDVIVFKNDHRTGDITSQTQLQQYMDDYLAIRDVLDQHPEKLFVMVSGPPRRPEATVNLLADNARVFYEWLQSPAYMNGHPNIMFFDLFDLLANPDDPDDPERNMLREEYRLSPSGSTDSHPNLYANQTVGPIFAGFLIHLFDPDWIDAPTGAETPAVVVATHGATPNPFNPLTRVRYELTAPATVEIGVFDLSGRLVRMILDGTHQAAGPHAAAWDGRDTAGREAPSGVYLYRIEAGRDVRAGRMALVR